jgi:predicted SnoaL-like aldol condensation-catalyzing enzyme
MALMKQQLAQRLLPLSAVLIALGIPVLSACSAQTGPATASPKEIVLAFYQLGLQDFKPKEAFAQYMTADFVEHAADSAGGSVESNVAFLSGLMKQSPPPKWEVVRSIAEGDLVFLHVRVSIGSPRPVVLGEIFRVEGGKIAEHWDIVQPAPENPINPNSLF